MEARLMHLVLLFMMNSEGYSLPNQFLRLYDTVNNQEMNNILNQSPEKVGENLYRSLYQNYILNSAVSQLDITILMDSSQSLKFGNFHMGKRFLSELILRMPTTAFSMEGRGQDKVRVAMISFAENQDFTREFRFNYSKFRECTRRAILGADYQNGSYTHLTPALLWAQNEFNQFGRTGAHKLLIIATDGKSNDDYMDGRQLIPTCQSLRNAGITTMVVPLGTELESLIIGAIASDDDVNHIFPVKNVTALERTLSRLSQLLRDS